MIKRLLCGLICAASVLSFCQESEAQLFPRLRNVFRQPVQATQDCESSAQACESSNCQTVTTTTQVSSVTVSDPVVIASTVQPVVVAQSEVISSAAPAASFAAIQSPTQFRSALLAAAEKARQEGQITRLDVMKLRLASLSPRALSKLQQAASEQLQSEGFTAIDWQGLADFLKEIMPLILQLIDLFS